MPNETNPVDLSTFDPETFLYEAVEGANDTKFKRPPEEDYEAVIETVTMKMVEVKKGDRAGQTVPVASFKWKTVNDAALRSAMRIDDPNRPIYLTQDVWLDLETSPAGKVTIALGEGKNVILGKIREAVGMNTGAGFSLKAMEGAGPAKIRVRHKDNADDPDEPFTRVTRVAPLSGR